ncbi:MAG TPA: GNAT family N-acetyltransferase [Fimbriimonadaceae bacterium]|nr:GNAT family N-acetyltransferase [Fimbriimonadaceae bacterium]
MRIGFQEAKVNDLVELWKECYPEKYWVSPELFKANTIESPLFDWGASSVELGINGTPLGFVVVKKCASPRLWKGQDPDQAHVCACAFKEPQVGVDLFSFVKRLLRNRGIYRLVFGQDSRHFFPGCPSDCQSLRDFLIIEGFQEGAEAVDLERDVTDYAPPPAVAIESGAHSNEYALRDREGAEATVRPIAQEDQAALRIFLNREFPGRWAYDTLNKIDLEERSDFVYGLFYEGTLHGFATTQDWTHRLPVGGGVWNLALGDRWGALGPIGVSRRVRGKGLGNGLLAAALNGLRERGARRTIIDWTALAPFYERHGFEITRTYRSFVLRLDG